MNFFLLSITVLAVAAEDSKNNEVNGVFRSLAKSVEWLKTSNKSKEDSPSAVTASAAKASSKWNQYFANKSAKNTQTIKTTSTYPKTNNTGSSTYKSPSTTNNNNSSKSTYPTHTQVYNGHNTNGTDDDDETCGDLSKHITKLVMVYVTLSWTEADGFPSLKELIHIEFTNLGADAGTNPLTFTYAFINFLKNIKAHLHCVAETIERGNPDQIVLQIYHAIAYFADCPELIDIVNNIIETDGSIALTYIVNWLRYQSELKSFLPEAITDTLTTY